MDAEDEFDLAIQALSLHAELESTYLYAYFLWMGRKIFRETDDIRWLDILYWQDLRETALIESGTMALLWLEHINDYRGS